MLKELLARPKVNQSAVIRELYRIHGDKTKEVWEASRKAGFFRKWQAPKNLEKPTQKTNNAQTLTLQVADLERVKSMSAWRKWPNN